MEPAEQTRAALARRQSERSERSRRNSEPLEELQPKAFGKGSIFDVCVTSADDLPFQIPVASYIEETFIGMRGAPTGQSRANIPAEEHMNWKLLSTALGDPAARAICEALFWIAVGKVFKVVDEPARATFRQGLSEKWFRLKLDLHGGVVTAPGKDLGELLDALPVIFVQAIFRLIVDAFPREHEKFVKRSQQLLEKLTQAVFVEIVGFPISAKTGHSLRQKIFCQHVIDFPFTNQKESLRHELRQEKFKKGQLRPLGFGGGEGNLAMEELQLSHLAELREKEKKELGSTSFAMQWANESIPPLADDDVNVDRYGHISSEGEQLLMQHLAQLYDQEPGQCDSGTCTAASDEDPVARTLHGGASASGKLTPTESPPLSPRQRTSVDTPANSVTAARSLGVIHSVGFVKKSKTMMMHSQQRRETEAAERRRRDELLERLLTAPMEEPAKNRALSTTFVSPLLDRLAPSGGDRSLLHKPCSETRVVAMGLPRRMAASRSEPSLVQKPGGDPLPARGEASPVGGAAQSEALQRQRSEAAGRKAAGAAASAIPQLSDSYNNKAAMHKAAASRSAQFHPFQPTEARYNPNITIEPPASLGHAITMARLEQQAEAYRKGGFDQYKKDYDMTTGNKKHTSDPEQLRAEENGYLNLINGLVGGKSTKPPRMLRQNAYAVNKGRNAQAREVGTSTLGARVWSEMTSGRYY